MLVRPSLRPLFTLAAIWACPAVGQTAAGGFPAWLAGTWAMEDGAAWADEVWTSPRGGMMLGLGRTGFGGGTDSWQSARIVRRADGGLALVIEPRGAAPIEYAQALVSPDSVEFANTGSGYPQRIRYWRAGQLLMLETSRADGSEAVRYNFRPVETAPQP